MQLGTPASFSARRGTGIGAVSTLTPATASMVGLTGGYSDSESLIPTWRLELLSSACLLSQQGAGPLFPKPIAEKGPVRSIENRPKPCDGEK